jgi:mRNA interferase MazF
MCPITTQRKGYPFEVGLPPGAKVSGAILADQVKSLDWRVRKAARFDAVSPKVLEEVIGRVEALMRG